MDTPVLLSWRLQALMRWPTDILVQIERRWKSWNFRGSKGWSLARSTDSKKNLVCPRIPCKKLARLCWCNTSSTIGWRTQNLWHYLGRRRHCSQHFVCSMSTSLNNWKGACDMFLLRHGKVCRRYSFGVQSLTICTCNIFESALPVCRGYSTHLGKAPPGDG